MPITKAQLTKRVATLNCTMIAEYQGRTPVVIVDAPAGKVFVTTDCHSISASCFDSKGAWAYLYAEVFSDMEDGLADCNQEDCEICHIAFCKDPQCGDEAHEQN